MTLIYRYVDQFILKLAFPTDIPAYRDVRLPTTIESIKNKINK